MRANYEPKKFIDKSLPATAPSAHSSFGKGSQGLYVIIIIIIIIIIGTSVCDNNHSLTSTGDSTKGKSCAIDLRVASSIPAEQLPIFFTMFFQFLQNLKAFVRGLCCCFPRLCLPGFYHPSYELL